MSENFAAGLSISISGILITFLALGIFILVMVLLQRLFPSKEAAASSEQAIIMIEEQPVLLEKVEEEDEDLPVIFATAISHFRSKAQSSLGTSLMDGKSGWWASNRMNAQQGLGIRIKRSGK